MRDTLQAPNYELSLTYRLNTAGYLTITARTFCGEEELEFSTRLSRAEIERAYFDIVGFTRRKVVSELNKEVVDRGFPQLASMEDGVEASV